MIPLVFATQNSHKIREVQHLLGNDFHVLGLDDIGFKGSIEEPYPSLEENAFAKARFVHREFRFPCVADDTGLEVEALGGAPGVLSSRYAEEKGPFLTEQSRFEANIQKLLENLERCETRKARFRTVLAFVTTPGEFIFEGICEGSIISTPRGSGGFGYDPVFLPVQAKKTLAEMSLEEKNRISHRALAFGKWKDFLEKNRNMI